MHLLLQRSRVTDTECHRSRKENRPVLTSLYVVTSLSTVTHTHTLTRTLSLSLSLSLSLCLSLTHTHTHTHAHTRARARARAHKTTPSEREDGAPRVGCSYAALVIRPSNTATSSAERTPLATHSTTKKYESSIHPSLDAVMLRWSSGRLVLQLALLKELHWLPTQRRSKYESSIPPSLDMCELVQLYVPLISLRSAPDTHPWRSNMRKKTA